MCPRSAGDQDGGVRRRTRTEIVQLARHSDPIALIGIFLSVGLAVSLDVTGAADGVESLLAGLMGTVVALVLDASARAERRFRLHQMFSATHWLPGMAVGTATAISDIARSFPGSEVENEAQRKLRHLVEELDELRRGRVVRHRDDYEHLLLATERCQRSLDAVTNIVSQPEWWLTNLAQRYWESNLEAIARGVRIRRIFICDELTPQVRAVLDRQLEAGVQVAVAPCRSLDPEDHLNYAVWDGTSAWEGRMNAQAQIVSNVFMVSTQDVGRFTQAFQRCWTSAGRYQAAS